MIPVRGRLRFDKGQWDGVAIATAALLAFSFVFGGASRLHELRLALVELAAIPVLLLAARRLIASDAAPPSRFALWLLAALTAIPLIQIIPLPPAVWTNLPGRDQPELALQLAGIPAGWLPISLSPERTWRSALALLPPIAVFLGMMAAPSVFRRRVALGLVAATLAAVLLGSLQFLAGGTRLYPWPTTDAGSVVGLFANRNHMATLCLMSLPFAAVIGARGVRRHGPDGQIWVWLSALFIGLVVVALGVIRSRAGLALVWPVLLLSLLAAWVASGRGRPRPLLLGLSGAAALAMVLVVVFASGPILQRFDPTGGREGRFENWPVVLEAANTYLPLGSGLGSFDAVYRSVEPLEQVDPTYFNQAHNDFLESWLETGWLGAALIAAFFIWFARRAWSAWRGPVSTDRDLQRAATVAIGAVLLHSFVDYPLRTETITALFAFCCALLELGARPDLRRAPSRSASDG